MNVELWPMQTVNIGSCALRQREKNSSTLKSVYQTIVRSSGRRGLCCVIKESNALRVLCNEAERNTVRYLMAKYHLITRANIGCIIYRLVRALIGLGV